MNAEDDKSKEITHNTTSDEIKDGYPENNPSDASKVSNEEKKYPSDKKTNESSSDVKKDKKTPQKDASITDNPKPSETESKKHIKKMGETAASDPKPSVKQSKKTFKKPTFSLMLSAAALAFSIIALSKPITEPDTGKLAYLYSELTQLKEATSKVAEIDHELLRLNIERSMYLLPKSDRPTLNKMLGLLKAEPMPHEVSPSPLNTRLKTEKSLSENTVTPSAL